MDKQKQKKIKKTSKDCKKKRTLSIGDRKLVGVRFINKKPHINIRAYQKDEHGRMFSTKRGIMLTLDEWERLKKQINDLDPSTYTQNNG